MNNSVGFIMSPAQNVLVVVMMGLLEYQAVQVRKIDRQHDQRMKYFSYFIRPYIFLQY